jgi:protein-S-isoprenylcysteine O-methyltransferase Ste14
VTSRLPALGPRGEGWVAAQLVLFAAIAALGSADLIGHGFANPWGLPAVLVGAAAIVIGGGVAVGGAWYLRASLSPFPRPVAGAGLVESGAYRLIRHPIYIGLVIAAVGWGTATASPLALVAAGLLFVLFDGKSRREEAWLTTAYPAYRDYQRRTKRFIPWIY